ncbi:DUF4249 domain-containing protein [Hymenobacter gummosus]|uniref:DUF4249 domain-containing protein n=1 Tax=Hymenobacter gummosus TaxID=1776032 RepID=A0A3S0H284_9BACT|nr:DUF4249 domain-containing protein [Hymenobacter gummosus]RTQ46580.1 DUF4249 domain-containing protein [Hymenobacter gummosus]
MIRRRLLSGAAGAAALLALLLGSCIDPFRPEVQDVATNYLVVDGFINSDGVSNIKLSRTFSVSTAASGTAPVESRAQVYVEDEQGARYPLTEAAAAPGNYASAALRLNPAGKYRLHLFAGGQEYASDYTAVRPTPPIDSVTWRLTPDGVQINVNTHDPSNQTRYYRWSYDETWEYTSAFRSTIEYAGGGQFRPRTEDIYRCWASRPSTAIRLSSTTRLSQDVVSQYPLLTLPPTAVQLRYKYSMLVRQYAQTAEEFAYWDLLRKNTESIGGLFDPLPAQLTGNLRCLSTPEAPVLGYVGVYSVAEKRLFISRSQLPPLWSMPNVGYTANVCPPDTIELPLALVYFNNNPSILPVEPYIVNGFLLGYIGAPTACVDCRLRGTNVRPPFWQ